MAYFRPALPEIILLIMIVVIMMFDLYVKQKQQTLTYALSQITLVVLALVTWPHFDFKPAITFNGQFIQDNLSVLLKMFMYLLTFMVLLYSRAYVLKRNMQRGEYHFLILLSLLGAMVLTSADSLLMVYLGLELMSLPLYAMVAMRREVSRGAEAAMKYFIMGALASGFLLYGLSLLYGLTDSILISNVAQHLMQDTKLLPVALLALAFVVAGMAFKLGAVPLHMWVPDVYEGSPTAVTAFIGTVPKLAAFAMMVRLLVEAMPSLQGHWHDVLLLLAVLSLFLGNILALIQKNIMRMFAYSTVAHIGFILLAFALGSMISLSYALFYVIVYVLMAVGGFGMVLMMSTAGREADMIEDFAGLNARNPWFAAMFMLLLFSMAGIPPLVGFDAKLSVITALVSQQHYWFAGFALIMSVVGAYYYIRVIKVMYFDTPKVKEPVEYSWDLGALLSFNGLLVLGLGILPAFLFHACLTALGS